MDAAQLERQFGRIRVWEQGAERAPHKPLSIVYAVGKAQRGEPPQIPYRDVEEGRE